MLRATTSIAVLLAGGVDRIAIAGTPEMARGWRRPGWLLAGEVGGIAPLGFDHGNSPVELAAVPAGARLILSTSNGTRAIRAARGAARVFCGALVNRRAVVAAAQASSNDVTIVCAGTKLATQVTLEDVYAAGRLLALVDGHLGDGAIIARRLAESFATPAEAFAAAGHGQTLLRLGFAADLAACAAEDTLDVVPEVSMGRRPVIAGQRKAPG